MKKAVLTEINEIKKMMGFLSEEETTYDLPISRIGDDDFNYRAWATNGKQIVLSGDKDGQQIRPIIYDVKGYHSKLGSFDVLIRSLSTKSGEGKSFGGAIGNAIGSMIDNLPNNEKIKKKLPAGDSKPKRKMFGLEGTFKPDTLLWQGLKRMIDDEYLSGDYLKVNISDSQVRGALKQLASSNGRSASIDAGQGVKLSLTKNREL